ncbi:MAG: DJ-1 family protein, partial [Eubacterium sp.]|nr:DJ-1 family protein [Eubacterium sp.]
MKNIYVFLGEGFETIEALTAVDVLRRGGADVKTVSI